MKKILLSEPFLNKFDKIDVSKTIDEGWVSTAGKNIKIFENYLKNFTKSKYAIACNSGTSALHIALKVLNIGKGDEVIVPTISFVATINSVKYNDANPIFMDADDNFNLDEDKTISFLKNRTYQSSNFCINKKTKNKIKAIIIAHIWGGGAKLKQLIKECKSRNIKIVEDAAESLGTFYTKKYLNYKHTGTVGDIGIISFNGNKIITTGAGGIILTNKKPLEKKSRYLINQARDDDSFVHNDVGYNYKMTSLNASLGISQYKKLKKIIKLKKKISTYYSEIFKNSQIFKYHQQTDTSINNCWMNVLFIKKEGKSKLIDYLIKNLSNEIQIRRVWLPNHMQKQFKKNEKFNIKNAYKLYNSSICVPSSANLTKKKILYIYKRLHSFYENFINSK